MAVGVTEDQYTIVHKYLFAAIADVLGEAITPDVAAAWDEVYWLMAGALIAQEARLYLEAQVQPGHPWRQWTVVERRQETPDTVSFLLRPADGAPAPRARAGQYVSVRVQMPDGVHQLRQYSLSSAPGDQMRRITVKRVTGEGAPDGEVSSLLHHALQAGDELTLSAPFGDVVLDDSDAPLVLVSAGIGCTPMVSMLEHLASTTPSRAVTVLHADRSPADHALRADTRRLVGALPFRGLRPRPVAGRRLTTVYRLPPTACRLPSRRRRHPENHSRPCPRPRQWRPGRRTAGHGTRRAGRRAAPCPPVHRTPRP